MIEKVVISLALLVSSFVPFEPQSSIPPANCVTAVQSLNLYFGETVPVYSSRQILDSLKFCRINDWNRQVALRISKFTTFDDYNYFAIPATALRGRNLTELRKWMCSVMMDRRRDNYDQNVFAVLPGCGEKLGANTRRYVTTTTSTTSTTTSTTTVAPPPPGLALGVPRETLAPLLYNSRVNGCCEVRAVFYIFLPISFVNNSVESICVESSDAEMKSYLLNNREYLNWFFGSDRSNCTELVLDGEVIGPVDLLQHFQIHVAFGKFEDGMHGLWEECFKKGQETCKAFELTISVKSSSVATVSRTVRAILQVGTFGRIDAVLT